jgi:hypothetical protein
VLTVALADELASLVAFFALLGSTPRSLSQPSIVFFASERCALRSPLWLVMPATMMNTTPTPSATIETSSSTALKPRGMP